MKNSKYAHEFLRFFTAPAPAGDVDAGASVPTPADVANSTSNAADGERSPDGEPEAAGAEALGDPGKKALDAMKRARNEARQQAREAQEQLAALKAQVEGREAEHAAQLEEQRIKDEALAKANERILKAEFRAAAAGKLSDPSDVLRFIDTSDFEVGDDGSVDAAAIAAAVEGLLESKPYLAAQGGTGPVFESPSSRRDPGKGQLTQADLQRMSPDEINAARAEGRLNDLLGIES